MQASEIFQLSSNETSDYSSFVFTMTVEELLFKAAPSDIQRMRNEKKELGIMNHLKTSIKKYKTPFLQPFILHYTGTIDLQSKERTFEPERSYRCVIDDEEVDFEYEVLDGNGRTNALLRLRQQYTRNIEKLSDPKKILENKMQLQLLLNTKITVQLYNNLTTKQKEELFFSVNQGEKMSVGRLSIYDDSKVENVLLLNYIKHTEKIDFPYIISVDKDTLRTAKDRATYIPAKLLLPVMRKFSKYCASKNIDNIEEFIFYHLDLYISEGDNPPHLRKQFFSILGTVLDAAKNRDVELEAVILKFLLFDYSQFEDVSKELKTIREAVVKYVFDEQDEQ